MSEYIYWDTIALPNGIEMFVEYEIKDGETRITPRSQLLIDKAMELNYMNREWVKKELDILDKELGVLE